MALVMTALQYLDAFQVTGITQYYEMAFDSAREAGFNLRFIRRNDSTQWEMLADLLLES